MPDAARNRAYLALGSNICPESNLPDAVRLLADFGSVIAVSGVWESRAVGDPHQANFVNAAVLLETVLAADQLKRCAIAKIEQTLGRVRDPRNKNAARTIDIDIALFNRDVISLGDSRIPDPEIVTRPFLVVPLAELDPGYTLPIDGRTLREVADSLQQCPPALIARPDVRLT